MSRLAVTLAVVLGFGLGWACATAEAGQRVTVPQAVQVTGGYVDTWRDLQDQDLPGHWLHYQLPAHRISPRLVEVMVSAAWQPDGAVWWLAFDGWTRVRRANGRAYISSVSPGLRDGGDRR